MCIVKLMPQGIEVALPAGSPLTELEFELYGQESIPFGCKAGVCGACVIEVQEGLDHLGNKGKDEKTFLESLGYPDEIFRLACQCRVTGAVIIKVADSQV
ncbi:2Fe-2S iron-sulfur cluster binding domain-containing protein [Paraburkholderia terricola]|jgi:ferredoxin|uniref:2Fe-2S iron-sulfur cluster binding domain-containing protein n=2 Tax=Paraburkholderia terricola TaxID=169427 RepID=A0A1M6K803_9BURK|nr:2Fe-2S iron-sulfur cluster binding domain-containing protein [Paraburkholderia sediminicola]SHJ55023.1 2Fe-2S iron-sulfur cluster binding domain-containing protein [Paraburkholderia terricola]